MTLTLNNTNSLSDTYATIEYVDNLLVASGGVSQLDFDSSIATLQSKDVSYNNTITSHISLIDTNTTDIATHTNDIAVLNSKQIQNFAGINDINTNLTNNYQTNSQLTTNFYNKTEIDTTLGNYYTSAQIDTTLGNYYTSVQIDAGFYNQTYVNNNIYTKTEVDGLIAGAGGSGYTNEDIDSFLLLKEDKSTFTDKISFTPIVDISAPTIIHSGLTLKNSTINIEPLDGLTFSNQFGAETDRDVAVFRNQTSYITMKGNKNKCNSTSDDSVKNLELNPDGDVVLNNIIVSTTGADVSRASGDTNYTLRVKDNQAIWEFRNRVFTCRNGSNENLGGARMEIQNIGTGEVQIGTASTARVGIGAVPNSSYFLTVAGTSNFDVIRSATRLDLIGDMYVKGTGSDIVRPSGDTNYTLRVRDTQAVWEFRNRNFRCMNPSNPSVGTEMILHDTGGDYRLRIGSTSDAEVGIGRQYNSAYFLTVGGISNFNQARVENNLEVLGEQLLNTNARIFQRADAFNSLNVITTAQMNFSLQSDRATDPTTGTICLQLDDSNGITLNRAVVNNQTFNSIGNITAEANLNVWGDLLFQHSSAIYENLNGSDYDLVLRNGDTDRAINLIVGAIGSTPEISVSEASVNLLGHLDITHSDVSGSQRVKMDNPDTDGIVFTSIAGANILEVSNTGIYVNGSVGSSSDSKLKENIKEINNKECIKILKYIKPKTFNFKGKKQSELGFIADDWLKANIPKEWQNLVWMGKDDYMRMDYAKTNVVLWGAVQQITQEKDELLEMVKTMKKEITSLKTEMTKLKKRMRGKDSESDSEASPKSKGKSKSKD